MSELQGFSRRNERGLLWQGILFFLGLAFIDGNAVVSVFVSSMGGSIALAGLVSAIRVVPSIMMQLFVGIQAGKFKNLPRFITVMMAAAYGLPLVMAVAMIVNISTGVALFAFMVLYALMWGGDGTIVIGWYDIFGRLVEPRRRGLILGRQQLFGGILALAGSAAVAYVLSIEALPLRTRYGILFGLAGLFMASSAIAMAVVREAPHRTVSHDNPLKRISAFPALFRASRLFQRMTAVQALQGVAVMALPILVLFSKQTFNLTVEMTAPLLAAQMAGSLAGGLLWGAVSHRLANRRVIQLNQCNILLIMALAIVAAVTGQAWLAYPLAFLSGLTFACWMGFPNYIIDITDEHHRPQYLVMSSLVNLPFTFMPWIAGRLSESFGFIPVFILCILAAVASASLSLGLREIGDKP